MARMSIDDKVRRDQRLFDLAELLGWSSRETFGAIHDVWEMCHDRVDAVLPEHLVNNRVFREAPPGTPVDFDFVGKMITVGYAKRHRSPRMITVIDAIEMIEYLKKSKKSGQQGGLNSGRSRRNNPKGVRKGRFEIGQGSLNLPDPVPDLDTSPDTSPDRSPDPADPEISPESASPVSDRRPTLRVVGPLDELANEVGAMHAEAFENARRSLKSEVPSLIVTESKHAIHELLEGEENFEGVRERLVYAIRIQEADAIKNRTLKHFGPGMWKPKNLAKTVTFDLADITGKRSVPSSAPVPVPIPQDPTDPVRSIGEFFQTGDGGTLLKQFMTGKKDDG